VDRGRNLWKKERAIQSTSAKNVDVQICRNCFQASLLGEATKDVIPVQPERVDFLREDVL
jgi:hypothetical protein